jgi:Zn finger protein HypA/HybF involved in hydrogenase expression
MENANNSITFSCPRCKGTFEFDWVDEYELVFCPICGTDFMTIRKGQRLLLEHMEFSQKTSDIEEEPSILTLKS